MGKKANQKRKEFFDSLPPPKPPPKRTPKPRRAPAKPKPKPAPTPLSERLTLPCGHRISFVQAPVGKDKGKWLYACNTCGEIGSTP